MYNPRVQSYEPMQGYQNGQIVPKRAKNEPKRTFDANSSRFGHMYAVLTKKYQKYPIFTYFALRPLIYAIWNLGHILQLKVKYTKVSWDVDWPSHCQKVAESGMKLT